MAHTITTMNEVKEVLTGSEINIVKMTCQDHNINGQNRVTVLLYCANNRAFIFGGSDTPLVIRQVIKAIRTCQNVGAFSE